MAITICSLATVYHACKLLLKLKLSTGIYLKMCLSTLQFNKPHCMCMQEPRKNYVFGVYIAARTFMYYNYSLYSVFGARGEPWIRCYCSHVSCLIQTGCFLQNECGSWKLHCQESSVIACTARRYIAASRLTFVWKSSHVLKVCATQSVKIIRYVYSAWSVAIIYRYKYPRTDPVSPKPPCEVPVFKPVCIAKIMHYMFSGQIWPALTFGYNYILAYILIRHFHWAFSVRDLFVSLSFFPFTRCTYHYLHWLLWGVYLVTYGHCITLYRL